MDVEPPYLRYQEADPVKQDRTTTLSRAPRPGHFANTDTSVSVLSANEDSRRTTPIPMPGRLPVARLVRGLPGQSVTVTAALADVDTDTMVRAEGTITAVRYLDGKVFGRTMIVLAAEDGNSAHVLFDVDSAYYAEPVLRKGSRIELHGLVTRHIPGQPTGLEGLGVRVVSA